MTDISKIRNFSIIAHIDHGKSTLADRLLEYTEAVSKRESVDRMLDNMELERERGITIKARAVNFKYQADDGNIYDMNLIDTPGHVDFNYEVSRSLQSCEGALLVVDATQGIQAKTLANAYLAVDNDLEILPVINKMDLPSANIQGTKDEIEEIIGIPAEDAPAISAKMGLNIKDVLEQIVKAVPAPVGDKDAPLKALIFDSYYDSYKGVVVYIRVKEGTVKVGDTVRMMHTGAEFELVEVGTLSAFGFNPKGVLTAGEVGYLTASIKNIADTEVGDTVTLVERPADEPLPGFKKVLPMVYSGIYPAEGAARYEDLKDALDKLRLNDSAFLFEPETSAALGFGFRCGFLGLLHMEIIQERLEREFNLDLITTAPSVIYHVYRLDGSMVEIDNPSNLPGLGEIEHMEEPYVTATIYTPQEFVGAMMDICVDKRGIFIDMQYEGGRVKLIYELPLNEIIYEFFDQVKSRSRGYASFDYELKGYMPSELVKMDILLNGDICDAFSIIVHKDKAYARGRSIAEKLKDVIPRQMFEIPIQAAIGGKVIARETVKADRKSVV